MARILSRAFGFADDHSNPILIKEIRQGSRSRVFLIFFALLLVAAMLIAVLATSDGDRVKQGRMGDTLFAFFASCLVVLGLGAVPWMAFRAVVGEREQNTFDLLQVSGLSPSRLVRGKLNIALLQLMVFTSAVAPFMVFGYLLRGIDIVVILLISGCILAASVLMIMIAVWLASLPATPAYGVLLQILLLLGCVAAVITGIVLTVGTVYFGQREVRDPDFWWTMLAVVVLAAMLFALFYTLTVARFSVDSANRSTWPRLVFLLLCQLPWIFCWIGYLADGRVDWEPVLGVGWCLSPLIFVSGLLEVIDSPSLSPRVRRQIPINPIAQLFVLLFFPGRGRGWLYFLLANLSALVLPGVLCGGWMGDRYWRISLWLAGYNLLYIGLIGGAFQMIFGRRMNAVLMRWMVLLITVGLMVLPMVFFLVAAGGDYRAPALLIATEPFWALGDGLYKHGRRFVVDWFLIIPAIISLGLGGVWVARDLKEQLLAAMDNRARRKQLARVLPTAQAVTS